ncbi:hypothetical protein KKI24_07015 [bacterium]|nr:hypothetical protein [bacterium]
MLKTIVCTKAVPGFITDPKVSDKQDNVEYQAGTVVINESDDYALEEAVKLKRKMGGSVTVISVGPLTAQKVLQTGLAKNADNAIRIDGQLLDTTKTAGLLVDAIRQTEFNLVLTGVESRDTMASQVGLLIAEKLAVPFSYAVTEIEPGDEEGTLKVTKEIGAGLKQCESIKLPAVLCLQTGTTPTSFVPLKKMMMVKNKPVKKYAVTDLETGQQESESPEFRVDAVFPPAEETMAELIKGTMEEIASKTYTKIKEAI